MTQEQKEFLDNLREDGQVNMFGASAYLRDEFGLDKRQSHEVLSEWMNSFSKE